MLKSHYRVGQATGISINLSPNGEVIISACSVVIKDNKLDIEKKVIDLASIDELSKYFPQKTLVSLNLFGKGVLQKQVARLTEINANTFTQVLPNGNPEDFYIQHFTSGDSSFVSIIRKAEADKWIEAVRSIGFTPMILSLGPFPVQNILEQLNFYDSRSIFDNHVIQQNDVGEWVSYKYEVEASAGFPIKVGAESINDKLILPYAAAFQLAVSPDVEVIHANVDALQVQFENALGNKKLRVKSFVTLVVFFLLLLINFFAFSWLYSANNALSEQLSISSRSVNDMEQIADQVKAKEVLLKKLGWDNGLNKAVLFDQLVSLLPEDIRLLEISINPVDAGASRIQKAVVFVDHNIKIAGSSANILPVNEWIARIKTLRWVKTVQMNNYAFNSELDSGRFIITITY